MPRAVLLAGGWAHPGGDLVDAVRELVQPRGFDLTVVTDPAEVPAVIAVGCDVLIVGCCWFAMTDARYSDEQRDDFAVPFEGDLRAVITGLIDAGCPILALHTAVISFDGAERWANQLGGAWNWATSWHPEPAQMMVRPHPSAPIEFPVFSVVDELYQGLDVYGSAAIVAESDQGDPLSWLHETTSGRAAVNLLGHDRRSLADSGHKALNEGLLDWLLASDVVRPEPADS